MTNILSYPYDCKYHTAVDPFLEMTAGFPLIPTQNAIMLGNTGQTEDGYLWSTTSDPPSFGNNTQLFSRETPGIKSGFGFGATVSGGSSSYNRKRWFDVGGEGRKIDGTVGSDGAKGSWMRNVTSMWFVVNAFGTSDRANARVAILQCALRYYIPSSRRIVLIRCNQEIAGYKYGYDFYGDNPAQVCGYALTSGDRDYVKRNNYEFLGFRIHVELNRDSSGNFRDDDINISFNGLTPGFGDPHKSINPNQRRIICRNHDIYYRDYQNEDGSKFPIEAG